MPERFEIYIVYKKRYINTLPFLISFYFRQLQCAQTWWGVTHAESVSNVMHPFKSPSAILTTQQQTVGFDVV